MSPRCDAARTCWTGASANWCDRRVHGFTRPCAAVKADDRDASPMRYAVVGCQCGNVWSIELRHATTTCTSCRKTADVSRRRRLWQGDNLREAQSAAAAMRTARAQDLPEAEAHQAVQALHPPQPLARHDSPIDAAAAKAHGIVNKSARAEAVALWMTRLLSQPTEDELMQAMRKAGLDGERAEREIVRMLAADVMYEPRVGHYAVLDQ